MELTAILILAIVQGVTEFLPISSSGHLVIVAELFRTQLGVTTLEVADVNIVLHAGTLLSIVVYYWRRILGLLGEDRRLIGLLMVATIPGGAFGVAVKLWFEPVLESALLAGILLMVTGSILLFTLRLSPSSGECDDLSLKQALLIGISQAVAILPGISRSGSTICTGLTQGLSPKSAATFSFLMAIPIIAGGAVWELRKVVGDEAVGTTSPSSLIAGAMLAFVVGLFSLHWLVKWLERGQLHYFAWWCIPTGAVVVAWQLASL